MTSTHVLLAIFLNGFVRLATANSGTTEGLDISQSIKRSGSILSLSSKSEMFSSEEEDETKVPLDQKQTEKKNMRQELLALETEQRVAIFYHKRKSVNNFEWSAMRERFQDYNGLKGNPDVDYKHNGVERDLIADWIDYMVEMIAFIDTYIKERSECHLEKKAAFEAFYYLPEPERKNVVYEIMTSICEDFSENGDLEEFNKVNISDLKMYFYRLKGNHMNVNKPSPSNDWK